MSIKNDLSLYRGTSLIRNSDPLGPYSRNMPRALWRPYGGGLFLMSEVPLDVCDVRLELAWDARGMHGHLTHKKPPPPLGPP